LREIGARSQYRESQWTSRITSAGSISWVVHLYFGHRLAAWTVYLSVHCLAIDWTSQIIEYTRLIAFVCQKKALAALQRAAASRRTRQQHTFTPGSPPDWMESHMAQRKIVTDRQHRAARLLLEGWSGVKALRAAGYGKSYSRKLGEALRKSWGLREALRLERETLGWAPRVRNQRRHRYDHKRVVDAIGKYATESDGIGPASQRPKRELDRLEDRVRRKACAACGRPTKPKDLFVDPSGRFYICPTCAGV
jgi:hypothetical protein